MVERLAASGTRQGLMLERSAGTPTALRCSVMRPVAELTPLPSVRYVQTGGDKSVYKRAARGAASPALLAAPEIAPAGYRLPRCHRWGLATKSKRQVLQRHRIGFSTEHQQRFRKGALGQVGGRL